MTRFLIQTCGIKPLLAAIAAHGLTDLDSPAWIPHYSLLTLLPLPSPIVTAMFCAASLMHFSDDVGVAGSVAMHAGVAVVGWTVGVQAAFKTMIGYLSFCHVPMHYARCYNRDRRRTALVTASVTMFAVLFSHSMGEWVPLTDRMQRLATAHIFTELSLANSARLRHHPAPTRQLGKPVPAELVAAPRRSYTRPWALAPIFRAGRPPAAATEPR